MVISNENPIKMALVDGTANYGDTNHIDKLKQNLQPIDRKRGSLKVTFNGM